MLQRRTLKLLGLLVLLATVSVVSCQALFAGGPAPVVGSGAPGSARPGTHLPR
jgi:hypothetical protein